MSEQTHQLHLDARRHRRARATALIAERDLYRHTEALTVDKSDPAGHWRWIGNTHTTDLDTEAERSASWKSTCTVWSCVNPDHQRGGK